jgi:AcrR family transcriptional regulator
MSKKTSPEPARAKQKRLSPEDRRKEFVAKATEFFSEEGFGGGTRDLARRLGVTQPLLYRYFPSKDDLIKEVYRTVYLEPLDTGWEKLLADRSRRLRTGISPMEHRVAAPTLLDSIRVLRKAEFTKEAALRFGKLADNTLAYVKMVRRGLERDRRFIVLKDVQPPRQLGGTSLVQLQDIRRAP